MSTKPRVWCSFTVKRKKGKLKLRIQDFTEDRRNECIALFNTYFIPEEAFNIATGIIHNAESMKETIEGYRKSWDNSRIVLCCIDDGSDRGGPIISASAMYIVKQGDSVMGDGEDMKRIKTKEAQKLVDVYMSLCNMYDVLKQYQVDKYYEDSGVVTHPDFRGLGLCQKLFNVRRMIIKDEGVAITGAVMTSLGSQKAAERDGWETIFEIPFEELGRPFDLTFEGAPPMCKYMVAKPL